MLCPVFLYPKIFRTVDNTVGMRVVTQARDRSAALAYCFDNGGKKGVEVENVFFRKALHRTLSRTPLLLLLFGDADSRPVLEKSIPERPPHPLLCALTRIPAVLCFVVVVRCVLVYQTESWHSLPALVGTGILGTETVGAKGCWF